MNVIEMAALCRQKQPGLKPLSPAIESALRLTYGLPLIEAHMPTAETITGMTAAQLRDLEGVRFREVWAGPGRRSWKTSNLQGLTAVREALFGGHQKHLMPGERALIPIISKDLAGAKLAQQFCASYLDALGIAYQRTSIGNVGVLRLPGSYIDIATLTNTTTAPRGFAMPVVLADEIAHWSTDDASANPDKEVLAAVRPAQAQFPDSLLIAASTPLGRFGAHYDTIAEHFGRPNTKVLALKGPTWVWNPSISEARTHELEPDARVWRREYLGEAQEAACALLDPNAVENCFIIRPAEGMTPADPEVGFDASAGKGDSTTAVVARWVTPSTAEKYSFDADGNVRKHPWGDPIIRTDWKVSTKPPWLRIEEVWGLDGVFWTDTSAGQIVDQVAALARRHGAKRVVGDQFNSFAFKTLFQRAGLSFTEQTWTGPSKANAVGLLRRLVADRQLEIRPQHEQLKRELLSFEEKITPSGTFSYDSRKHADYLASIITLLMREQSGGMPRTPNKPSSVLKVGTERLWF